MDENRIDSEFQMDGNYYVELRQICLAVKLYSIKGRGYQT